MANIVSWTAGFASAFGVHGVTAVLVLIGAALVLRGTRPTTAPNATPELAATATD